MTSGDEAGKQLESKIDISDFISYRVAFGLSLRLIIETWNSKIQIDQFVMNHDC